MQLARSTSVDFHLRIGHRPIEHKLNPLGFPIARHIESQAIEAALVKPFLIMAVGEAPEALQLPV